MSQTKKLKNDNKFPFNLSFLEDFALYITGKTS